jgi:Glycosyltransferase family 87
MMVTALRSTRDHASSRHAAVWYIAGNGGALVFALVTAYLELVAHGGVNINSLSDFIAYYVGSHLALTGHAAHVYDLQALSRLEGPLALPMALPWGVIPYVYPPFMALFLAPLAVLPFTLAYVIWMIGNCLLLAACMFCLERYALLSRKGSQLFRIGAFCSLPVLAGLFQAQLTFLLLASLVGCFLAARAGRDVLAGALLAGLLLKPPYLAAFLVLFVVMRRWRVLASLAGTGLIVSASTIPFFGLSMDRAYIRTLIQAAGWHTQYGYGPVLNQSVSGLAGLLLSARAATAVWAVFSIVGVLVLVWCCLDSRSMDLPFAVATVVMLLISPHVLIYDLSLLLIPIAIAVRHREGSSLGFLLPLCYVTSMIGVPIAFKLPIQLSTVATLLLGAWLVRATLTARPAERPVASPVLAADRAAL